MRTAILGVGNCLMKDDGVGVHAVRALSELPLPAGVAVIDAGTCPDVIFDTDFADRVIIIDAVHGDGPPGTLYRLAEEALLAPEDGFRSCHDVSLVHALREWRPAVRGQVVVVIGIEPKEVAWGLDLSPEVAACLPRVLELVKEEL